MKLSINYRYYYTYPIKRLALGRAAAPKKKLINPIKMKSIVNLHNQNENVMLPQQQNKQCDASLSHQKALSTAIIKNKIKSSITVIILAKKNNNCLSSSRSVFEDISDLKLGLCVVSQFVDFQASLDPLFLSNIILF